MTGYNGYEVNTAELRRRAAPFKDYAERMKAVFDELREAQATEGSPWGKDQYGQQFIQGFAPRRDGVDMRFKDGINVLRGVGAGLDGMAGRYEGAERLNEPGSR